MRLKKILLEKLLETHRSIFELRSVWDKNMIFFLNEFKKKGYVYLHE